MGLLKQNTNENLPQVMSTMSRDWIDVEPFIGDQTLNLVILHASIPKPL
jgi:hypothetical protein